mgnify:CR=1 FL=1
MTVNVANSGPSPFGYAVEYYHDNLDHYFISASATDIAALDSGKFIGWARTGYTFKVYTQPQGTANPVCRFYIPPGLGDSHFYSASRWSVRSQWSSSRCSSRNRTAYST